MLLVAAIASGCKPRHRLADPPAQEAKAFTSSDIPLNSDVHWEGTFFGLWPTLESPQADRIRVAGMKAKDALLDAMRDEPRYVAAHLLLNEIAGKEGTVTGRTWHGLRVTLHAGHIVTLYADDAPVLRSR